MELHLMICSKCKGEIPPESYCSKHNVCRNCMKCPVCPNMKVEQLENRYVKLREKFNELIQGTTAMEKREPSEEKKSAKPISEKQSVEMLKELASGQGEEFRVETSTTRKSKKEELKEICEGRKVSDEWKCDWKGSRDQMPAHFMKSHEDHCFTLMEPLLLTEMHRKPNSGVIYLIRLKINQEERLFWYIQMVEVEKKFVCIVVQNVGATRKANKYYYDITITNNWTSILKIRETCESNTSWDMENLDSKRCAIIPFDIIDTYLKKEDFALILQIDSEELDDQIFPPPKSFNFVSEGIFSNAVVYVDENFLEGKNVFSWLSVIHTSFTDTESFNTIAQFSGEWKHFTIKCRNNMEKQKTCFWVEYEGKKKPQTFFYSITMPINLMGRFKITRECLSASQEVDDLNENNCLMIPFKIIKQLLTRTQELAFQLRLVEKNNYRYSFKYHCTPIKVKNVMADSVGYHTRMSELVGEYQVREKVEPVGKSISDVESTCQYLTVLKNFFGEETQHYVGGCFIKAIVNYTKNSRVTLPLIIRRNTDKDGVCVLRIELDYRHDPVRKALFWTVKYEDPKNEHYEDLYYEVNVLFGPSQFFKALKPCGGNTDVVDELIEAGECVAIPFDAVKRYLKKNTEFYFLVRVFEYDELFRTELN